MKRVVLSISVLLCTLLVGCAKQSIMKPMYAFQPPSEAVSYVNEVKPILEKRCVVCHSCYNSPCQLKMSSWEGLDRGASKEQVYNASRLSTMEPSRLFIDAQTTAEWREKRFFGVKPEEGSRQYDDSVMFMLLDHKRKSPDLVPECSKETKFEAEANDLTCPESTAEVNNYLKTHPNRGMPFGFPPLNQGEFKTVVGWLTQGAIGPTDEEQAVLKSVPQEDQEWIDKWEAFLNITRAKERLTARYLYEHLFLAHITFKTETGKFYELVRSKTPPGKPIDVIATVRPYDDPGTTQFWYRFRLIHSAIVHKTHMVLAMDQYQYDRVQQLFMNREWDAGPYRQSYDDRFSANPFRSFERIPVRSRYEWLLDNAHYIIMTFIRGPVCKGQVALNVINDQFWLLFMDPDYDVSVLDREFLKQHYETLRMPAEEGSMYRLTKSLIFWKNYKRWAFDYYQARQEKYAATYPGGLGIEAIWKGNRQDDQPMLTVFRHFDSASVHRGALGKLPKTAWVMDYPILERIYYSLVAGFDVYGSAGHQLSTRRYMDALRIEGESSFLQFMPRNVRKNLMKEWYLEVKEGDLQYHPTAMPSKFPYTSTDPKREFLEELVNNHFQDIGIAFDKNYLKAGETYPDLPTEYNELKDYVQGFRAVSSKDASFLKRVHDHNANVAWLKINLSEKESMYISMLVDRWHDNVKYIRGEDQRLNPKKDKVDVIEGLVGSYPNYFFEIDREELDEFFKILFYYDGGAVDICRLEKYGINRAEPQFWEKFDLFQEALRKQNQEQAGIIDLNRYYSLAMQKELYEGGTELECREKIVRLRQEKNWWDL